MEEGSRAMQRDEMKDFAHGVMCKEVKDKVAGCAGDMANVEEGLFIRRNLVCSTELSLQDDST